MEAKNIHNLIILDESGSMECIKEQAVSAMNETIITVKKAQEQNPEQNYFISLVVFEGDGIKGVRTVRDRIPAAKVDRMSRNEYRPGGCTPLYDAIGSSVNRLMECTCNGDPVMVTVITDGYENSSSRYGGAEIKNLVERQRKAGWTFSYIGANQDAIEAASDLNISNALNWEATEEGTKEMSENLSRSVMYYCMQAPTDASDMEGLFDKKKRRR